jgi:hypothetical protein
MSAARRAAGLTKYLSRSGHRVTVLTSVMSGSGPVAGADRTIRTRDLLVSPLNWRRAGFAALQGESGGGAPAAPSALASVIVPDLQMVGWVPFALTRAMRLVATESFDCVITSSPPASAHLIGLTLQRLGVPWVADFRDGWTFESQRPEWAMGGLAALDGGLERLAVTHADGISAVTEPIAADLRTRFDRPVETITNGFDPESLAAGPDDVPGPPPEAARRTVVHTGTLAYGGRPLAPLLAALHRLRDTAPSAAERLEIVLIGPITHAERGLIDDAGLADMVRADGPVAHDHALAVQRAADALLVITGPGQTGVATGKLYEYLTAGRPILVIGDETAAARIVHRTGAGVAVGRDDPTALCDALRRVAENPDDLPRPTPEAVAPFAYPALAAQMTSLVEQAIDRRAGD